MSAKQRIKVRAGSHLGEVLPFSPLPSEGVFDVVGNVNEMLGEGVIDGIAVAITFRNGEGSQFYAAGSNRMTLLGVLQMLERRMMSDQKVE